MIFKSWFFNARIIIVEIMLTMKEPAMSNGKCTPTNTLESPPMAAKQKSIIPVIVYLLKLKIANDIANINVAWSDGNDESGLCGMRSLPK